MLHDILRDEWANAVGVAKFLSPEASCGEAVVVHGKDRTLQCYTGSKVQVVVWGVGGRKVQEKENESAAREVVVVGRGRDVPEVPV